MPFVAEEIYTNLTEKESVNLVDWPELNEKLSQALIKSLEWGDKIPFGIFYKNEIITEHGRRLADKIPNYLENPPATQKISSNGKPTTDISKLLDSLQV